MIQNIHFLLLFPPVLTNLRKYSSVHLDSGQSTSHISTVVSTFVCVCMYVCLYVHMHIYVLRSGNTHVPCAWVSLKRTCRSELSPSTEWFPGINWSHPSQQRAFLSPPHVTFESGAPGLMMPMKIMQWAEPAWVWNPSITAPVYLAKNFLLCVSLKSTCL